MMKRVIKTLLGAATRNRLGLRVLDLTVVKAARAVALERQRALHSPAGSQESLYHRFAGFTRIPEPSYYANLSLVSAFCDRPGSVVECGVWRGGMSAGMACVLGPERHYYLFDSFEGLPTAASIDGERALTWQADNSVDGCRTEEAFAHEAMRQTACRNYAVIKGWFSESLPGFRAATGIAILRLDADWYSSTAECLNHLYGQVLPGGLIIMDDYYAWDGCSRALHDFLSFNRLRDRIREHEGLVCYLTKSEDAPVRPIDPHPSDWDGTPAKPAP
jgi:O-methyltransferase